MSCLQCCAGDLVLVSALEPQAFCFFSTVMNDDNWRRSLAFPSRIYMEKYTNTMLQR